MNEPADKVALSEETAALPEPKAKRPAPPAIRDVSSHARLWLVAIAGLALDLDSKHWVFSRLDPNPMEEGCFVAIPHVMTFRRSLNPGALFGLGKGLTPVFIAASVLALGFVLFLFYHSTRDRRSLHVALAMVLAGALGNLYDRSFMIADVVRYTDNGRDFTMVGKVLNPGEEPMRLGTWPEGKYPRVISPRANPTVQQRGVVRDFIKLEPHLDVHLQGRTLRLDLWPWVFNVADVLLVVGVGVLMLNFWWERRAERAAQAAAAESASAHSPESRLD